MARRADGASLVAAATRVDLGNRKLALSARPATQDWQEDAWAYFDAVPEVKFGVLFSGNALAKLRLFAAVRPPGSSPDSTPVPVDDPDSGVSADLAASAMAEVRRLGSGKGGTPALLRRLNENLEIVGEAWLIGRGEILPTPMNPAGRPETWEIRSVSEVEVKNVPPPGWVGEGSPPPSFIVRSDPSDRTGETLDPNTDTAIRLWQEHPRWAALADCNMRGVLGECKILQVLSQQVLASAMRAASAGFLLVPNGLSFGAADPTRGDDGEGGDGDPLLQALADVLMNPIDDPSDPSSVQPGLIRGEAELLKPDVFRHLKFWDSSADAALEEKIKARVDRLARGMNLPVEVLMGHMSCVDTETEILTADGWKRWDGLRRGEEVLTLNHETGLSEWHHVEDVHSTAVADHPMIEMVGRSHSSLSTLDHRWPVITMRGKRRWRESASLGTAVSLIPCAPSGDLPQVAKYADAFVELVAWYWTEGTNHGGDSAVIYQSERANPQHVAAIRRCLTDLVGPASASLHRASRGSGRSVCEFPGCGWPIHSHGLCDAHRGQRAWGSELHPVRRRSTNPGFVDDTREAWRESRSGDMVNFRLNKLLATRVREVAIGAEKVVSSDFIRALTAAQLELFLARSVDGDGSRTQLGHYQLHQSVEARADAFELACVLSGRAVTRRRQPSQQVLNGRTIDSLRYQVITRNPSPHRVGFGVQKTEVNYTGVVWCPVVANGTWLARRNGKVFFTGNTTFANAAQVDQDTFEDYLEPRCGLVVDFFSAGFLRPNLLDAGFALEDVDQIVVWYDPAALIAQPNVEENASEALSQFAISERAYRSAKGFSEDDAPDALEVIIRAGLRRGILTAELTAALIRDLADEAGVDLPDPATLAPGVGGGAPPASAMHQLAALLLSRDAEPARPITAASRRTEPNAGARLVEIDRELRTRLLVAANDAMNRALERAGNRLRSRSNGDREVLRNVPSQLVAATLGPRRALRAASADDALEGAWTELERSFMAWGATAQTDALDAVARLASGFSTAERAALQLRQAASLGEAWAWMREALQALAAVRMFDPSPAAPSLGEHDPTLSVPAGLVRQAIARAGGATNLVTNDAGGAWITLADAGTSPAGGIGTGELVMGALRDHGVATEGYVWVYGPAHRARPFEPHVNLDGSVVSNFDDPAWANNSGWPEAAYFLPGDHAGSLLAGTVVEGLPATATSLRWYEGAVVELTTASGQFLAVTPNHPVLTDRGWVAAQALVEGDHVIRCLDAEATPGLVPDQYQRPAAVEDLFAARWVAPSVIACAVPVAAENFHGDGVSSEIAVVCGDSDLVLDGHASNPKPVSEQALRVVRPAALRLANARRPFEGLLRVGPATLALMGEGRQTHALLGRASGREQELRLPLAAWRDSSLAEPSVDDVAVDAEMLGESLDGLAGFVQFDKLVVVHRRRGFSGHVFDLHTASRWYVAAGLIVHNCVCDAEPVLIPPADAEAT